MIFNMGKKGAISLLHCDCGQNLSLLAEKDKIYYATNIALLSRGIIACFSCLLH